MSEDDAPAGKFSATHKAAAAVFATVLAPVLVALGMKFVEKVDVAIPGGASGAKASGDKQESTVVEAAKPAATQASEPSKPPDSQSGLFKEVPLKSGWSFYQTEPGELDIKRFDFRPDGTIAISTAGPKGVLLRPTDYENFKLSFDWRFAPGTKSGKGWAGGVILRSGLESWADNRLTVTYANGHIGQIHAGRNITLETTQYKDGITAKAGEWHTMSITCQGKDVTVKLDDAVITKVTNCSRKTGRVGLAVDTRDMEFRDFKVTRTAAESKRGDTKKSDSGAKKKSKS